MKQQVYNKVRIRLIFIQQKCFELCILDYQYFLFYMSTKITTSGKIEKLINRLTIEEASNGIGSSAIKDKFFLELAKIFEPPSKDETLSFPNLKKIIEKNRDIFDGIILNKIDSIFLEIDKKLNDYSFLINNIRAHRDKCLGHNDKKLTCSHLDDITTLDTGALIDIFIEFTNQMSKIFLFDPFPYEKLTNTKNLLSTNTFERIKKMESS